MKWTKQRRETNLLKFICEHGVGHPCYGSALWIAEETNQDLTTWMIHGCDGCCRREDFPGTAAESLVEAHKIIRDWIKEYEALVKDYVRLKNNTTGGK